MRLAVLFLVLLYGCASAPTSGLVFGVMGDVPYTAGEVQRLEALIDDINRERLDFVVRLLQYAALAARRLHRTDGDVVGELPAPGSEARGTTAGVRQAEQTQAGLSSHPVRKPPVGAAHDAIKIRRST